MAVPHPVEGCLSAPPPTCMYVSIPSTATLATDVAHHGPGPDLHPGGPSKISAGWLVILYTYCVPGTAVLVVGGKRPLDQ